MARPRAGRRHRAHRSNRANDRAAGAHDRPGAGGRTRRRHLRTRRAARDDLHAHENLGCGNAGVPPPTRPGEETASAPAPRRRRSDAPARHSGAVSAQGSLAATSTANAYLIEPSVDERAGADVEPLEERKVESDEPVTLPTEGWARSSSRSAIARCGRRRATLRLP